jgi:DNA-binding response OmpR family regulator
MQEFLARLRALSRRASDGPKTNELKIADLSLDILTHRAKRGERVITLTAKEFAVLECLMRHPDQVLSRNTIGDHVWNYEKYHESNIVDVYIRNLRRKIDDPSEVKLIRTVRGVGYRISLEGTPLDV